MLTFRDWAKKFEIKAETKEGKYWEFCYQTMRKFIVEIALPNILEWLPKSKGKTALRTDPISDKKKLLNFIEKSDFRMLNSNLAFFMEKGQVMLALHNQMKKEVNLQLLFPAAETKKRNYFLAFHKTEKEYSNQWNSPETTFAYCYRQSHYREVPR